MVTTAVSAPSSLIFSDASVVVMDYISTMHAVRFVPTVPGCMVVTNAVFTPHRSRFIHPKFVKSITVTCGSSTSRSKVKMQVSVLTKVIFLLFAYAVYLFECRCILNFTFIKFSGNA